MQGEWFRPLTLDKGVSASQRLPSTLSLALLGQNFEERRDAVLKGDQRPFAVCIAVFDQPRLSGHVVGDAPDGRESGRCVVNLGDFFGIAASGEELRPYLGALPNHGTDAIAFERSAPEVLPFLPLLFRGCLGPDAFVI